jgi:hypothetical protein
MHPYNARNAIPCHAPDRVPGLVDRIFRFLLRPKLPSTRRLSWHNSRKFRRTSGRWVYSASSAYCPQHQVRQTDHDDLPPCPPVVHTGARPRTHVCTLTYRRGSHWSCSRHPPAGREPCMAARGRCCLASALRFLETGIPSTGTACILARPAPGSHAAPPTQPRPSLTPRITSLARKRGAPVGIRLV